MKYALVSWYIKRWTMDWRHRGCLWAQHKWLVFWVPWNAGNFLTSWSLHWKRPCTVSCSSIDTASLGWTWFAQWVSSTPLLRHYLFEAARQSYFYEMGFSAPTPNPQPGGPGYPITFDLSGIRGPYQQLRYRQHSSQDPLTTQAALLHQSMGTFGGACAIYREEFEVPVTVLMKIYLFRVMTPCRLVSRYQRSGVSSYLGQFRKMLIFV